MCSRVKVGIVGGGLVGLALADVLRVAGLQVSLFERGRLGQEASSAAGGILGAQTETFGPTLPGQGLAELVHARTRTLAWVTELEAAGHTVDLSREGVVRLAFTEDEAEALRARRYEPGVELLEPAALHQRVPGLNPEIVCGLHLLQDAHLDPVALVRAAAAVARGRGVQIHEHAEVTALHADDGMIVVQTGERRERFERVVVAAGSWTQTLCPEVEVRPVRGQMLELQLPARSFGPVVYGGGAYCIPRADGRVTVGSTMEEVGYDRTPDTKALADLRAAAVRNLPAFSNVQNTRTWCGFRPFSPAGLVLGEGTLPGSFVLSGHHRNGVLLARASAERLAPSVYA